MKDKNSQKSTKTLIKQGRIKVIINWYIIIIINAIQVRRQINFKPAKNLKQLKKLLSISIT